MEINLDNNRFGNMGFAPQGVGLEPSVKPQEIKTPNPQNIQVPTFDALQSSEPVADVPDTALLRDDPLGKLVNTAFNLPPPPMPTFTD